MRFGVLGGIGPHSTYEFYKNVISSFEKKIRSNEEFPQILINSIPAPELIDLNSRKKLAMYYKGLKELDTLKPDFIVMVCNTIHLYHDELQKAISTPILNLPKLVEDHIQKCNYAKIGIIGTPSTIKEKLYEFSQYEYIYPTKKELNVLSDAIKEFNLGINCQKNILVVQKIAKKLLKNGAECVILGCSEFGLMLGGKKTLNPMDLMVRKIVENTIFKYL